MQSPRHNLSAACKKQKKTKRQFTHCKRRNQSPPVLPRVKAVARRRDESELDLSQAKKLKKAASQSQVDPLLGKRPKNAAEQPLADLPQAKKPRKTPPRFQVSLPAPQKIVQPKPTPEEVYQLIIQKGESIQRTTAHQVTKVDRSRRSWLHEEYRVLRNDGVGIKVTAQFLSLFYDLTIPQVMSLLDVNVRTMRRLRIWCNVTRWPRTDLLENKHSLLTLQSLREERLRTMRWAHEQRDSFVYAMLFKAHTWAGCSAKGMPHPNDLLTAGGDEPAEASDEQPSTATEDVGEQAATEAVGQQASPAEPTEQEKTPAAAQVSAAAADDAEWSELLVDFDALPGTDFDNEEWKEFIERTSRHGGL